MDKVLSSDVYTKEDALVLSVFTSVLVVSLFSDIHQHR